MHECGGVIVGTLTCYLHVFADPTTFSWAASPRSERSAISVYFRKGVQFVDAIAAELWLISHLCDKPKVCPRHSKLMHELITFNDDTDAQFVDTKHLHTW